MPSTGSQLEQFIGIVRRDNPKAQHNNTNGGNAGILTPLFRFLEIKPVIIKHTHYAISPHAQINSIAFTFLIALCELDLNETINRMNPAKQSKREGLRRRRYLRDRIVLDHRAPIQMASSGTEGTFPSPASAK